MTVTLKTEFSGEGGSVERNVDAGPSTLIPTSTLGAAARPRRRFRPTLHLTEEPVAPAIDQRILDEAAAQAAASAAGFEGFRRTRRFNQRRTVDYHASQRLSRLVRSTRTNARADKYLFPSTNHVVGILPPDMYALGNGCAEEDAVSMAVTTNLVHTSTNKIRCPVNVVCWQPEGRRLLTGSQSGEFTLWNGLTFNFETIFQAHDQAIRAVSYCKSGQFLISSDQGGVIKYFQSNMNNIQALTGHREAVRGLSFSPDDSRFVSASDDSTLKIWAFDEAREEKTLKGHGWDAKCVAWHPSKGLLVSGGKDNLIKFWDPRSGNCLGTFHAHKSTVQQVAWSNFEANIVASASTDQTVKLYDIRMMKEYMTFKGHAKEACSLAWHPSQRSLLVSGGGDGSLHYWSTLSTEPSQAIYTQEQAHDSNVWSIAWHPLGQILASGSNDHTTRFWERARPEDGRREEGGAAVNGVAGADKKEMMKRKARSGGEDWDDDYIPGLTSASRRAGPHSSSSLNANNAPHASHFSQSLGFNNHPSRALHEAEAFPSSMSTGSVGERFVPPPREGGALGGAGGYDYAYGSNGIIPGFASASASMPTAASKHPHAGWNEANGSGQFGMGGGAMGHGPRPAGTGANAGVTSGSGWGARSAGAAGAGGPGGAGMDNGYGHANGAGNANGRRW